jgi:transcription antitermination protein NusB
MPSTQPPSGSTRSRRLARERAMQALYQWQLTGQPLAVILAQFMPADADEEAQAGAEPDRELEQVLEMEQVDVAFFEGLLHGVLDRLEDWDSQLAETLDRPPTQLDPTERACLRLGCFELNECIDVPCRVVINEYVNLAKRFGAKDSYRYINGVLDRVARGHRLRLAEITAVAADKSPRAGARAGRSRRRGG